MILKKRYKKVLRDWIDVVKIEIEKIHMPKSGYVRINYYIPRHNGKRTFVWGCFYSKSEKFNIAKGHGRWSHEYFIRVLLDNGLKTKVERWINETEE